MSVNTKLTNLANEIREISGTTTKKSLDVMTSDISAANDLIDEQEALLNDLRDIVDTLPEPISGVEYHPDDDGYDGLSIDRSFSYIDIKQENEIYTYADCLIMSSGNLQLDVEDETTNLKIGGTFNTIEFNADNRISLTGYTTVFASGDVDSQLDLTSFNGQVDAPTLVAENIKSGVNILGVTGTYEGSGGGGSLETCTVSLETDGPVPGGILVYYTNENQELATETFTFKSPITIKCLKNSIISTNNGGMKVYTSGSLEVLYS